MIKNLIIRITRHIILTAGNKRIYAKRFAVLLFFVTVVMSSQNAFAVIDSIEKVKTPLRNESLRYEIFYNWGIIWKKAAEATLSSKAIKIGNQPKYQHSLIAQTMKFADLIFKVRDTLIAITDNQSVIPHYYAKIANENGRYSKDEIHYNHQGDNNKGRVKLLRAKRAPLDTIVSMPDNCFDMLSVFYYLRSINLQAAKMNQLFEVNILSGLKPVKMLIRFKGRTILKTHDDRQYSSYRIQLSLINDKAFKGEDESISVWLSDDEWKIPLMIEGKLQMGSLKAIYKE